MCCATSFTWDGYKSSFAATWLRLARLFPVKTPSTVSIFVPLESKLPMVWSATSPSAPAGAVHWNHTGADGAWPAMSGSPVSGTPKALSALVETQKPLMMIGEEKLKSEGVLVPIIVTVSTDGGTSTPGGVGLDKVTADRKSV